MLVLAVALLNVFEIWVEALLSRLHILKALCCKVGSSLIPLTFYEILWLKNAIFHFVQEVIIMVLILHPPVELYMMFFTVKTCYGIEQFVSVILATFWVLFTHVGNGKYFNYILYIVGCFGSCLVQIKHW